MTEAGRLLIFSEATVRITVSRSSRPSVGRLAVVCQPIETFPTTYHMSSHQNHMVGILASHDHIL